MAAIRVITADIASPQPFSVSGDFRVYGTGTFGSGTAQLQRRNLAGTFEDIIAATYTTAFSDEILSDSGQIYRFTMTGSTTPALRIEIPNASDFSE